MDDLERAAAALRTSGSPAAPRPRGGPQFSIGFVCTANRFRSVLAAEVAAHALEELPVRVCSAGTHDVGPATPLPGALEAAARLGIDITAHRAHVLSPGDLADYDLVVGFETTHVAAAVVDGRAPIGRTFTLPEIVDLIQDVRPDEALDWRTHTDAVLCGIEKRPEAPGVPRQIPDPAHRSRAVQRAIAHEVIDLTDQMVRGLFGDESIHFGGDLHGSH